MSETYRSRVRGHGYGVQHLLNVYEVPDRHLQVDPPAPVPVTVRLVWADDGPEEIDTVARSWSGELVLVDVIDARSLLRGVWVHKDDVRRR